MVDLSEFLPRGGGLNVWILPTGYGKTTALMRAGLRHVRVVHVLPLQAIVQQLATRLQSSGFDVCYQAGMSIPGVCKSPYLAAMYNVVTLDSFILNLFGIPVHEMFRETWHSDVAWLLARFADFVIFDEYHLMVSPDGDGERGDYSKIQTSVKTAIEILRKRGLVRRGVLVLTATLTPSMVADLQPDRVLVYAPSGHRYVDELRRLVGETRVEVIEPNDEFRREMEGKLKGVKVIDVAYEEICRVRVPDISVGGGDYVALNSWRRSHFLWERDKRRSLLLHGKIGVGSRQGLLELITSRPLIATQVAEAGIDVSFKRLVTEAAPAFSIIQRTGRVARFRDSPKGNVEVMSYLDAARGVYDEEITEVTFRLLQEHGEEINWKVPVGKYDYLQLLTDVDDKIRGKLVGNNRDVENLLGILDEIAVKPEWAIEELDKRGGTLVRSSAILKAVAGGDEIPLDVETLRNLSRAKGYDRVELEVRGGKTVEVRVDKLAKRPLTTLWEVMRRGGTVVGIRLRKEMYDEYEVGVDSGRRFISLKPC